MKSFLQTGWNNRFLALTCTLLSQETLTAKLLDSLLQIILFFCTINRRGFLPKNLSQKELPIWLYLDIGLY